MAKNKKKRPIELHEPAVAYAATERGISTHRLQDDLYLMDRASTGISYQDFAQLQKQMPFDLTQWATFLQMPLRTLYRYRTDQRAFHDHYAERIIQILRVVEVGRSFFSSDHDFFDWLQIPAIAFEGRKPVELFSSSFGLDLVSDHLGRMAHGIYV